MSTNENTRYMGVILINGCEDDIKLKQIPELAKECPDETEYPFCIRIFFDEMSALDNDIIRNTIDKDLTLMIYKNPYSEE